MNQDDDVVDDIHATYKDHNEDIYIYEHLNTLCMNLVVMIIFIYLLCMMYELLLFDFINVYYLVFFFTDITDDQTSFPFDLTSSRSNKRHIRLKCIWLKHVSGDKTPLTIDVHTSLTSGPNGDMFNNYLGVMAHDKISILISPWDHVSEVDRTTIWEDILVMYVRMYDFKLEGGEWFK